MEGNKAYHAKIAEFVRQNTKFHLMDRVKIKKENLTGFVDAIGSLSLIAINSTKVYYLVNIDETHSLRSFHAEELQLIITPEKVQFS